MVVFLVNKVKSTLLPTDEKRPTDLEKSFSCLISRGLKKPAEMLYRRASSIGGRESIRWPLFIRWAFFLILSRFHNQDKQLPKTFLLENC